MKPTDFLAHLDHDAIIAAIRAAERQTSGEIRVHISRHRCTDPMAAARARFLALGMKDTAARNAVLIYLAPESQQFAIIGDEAIHQHAGDSFWTDIAAQMSTDLRTTGPTAALVRAIEQTGALLARHFAYHPDDRNELPDTIDRD